MKSPKFGLHCNYPYWFELLTARIFVKNFFLDVKPCSQGIVKKPWHHELFISKRNTYYYKPSTKYVSIPDLCFEIWCFICLSCFTLCLACCSLISFSNLNLSLIYNKIPKIKARTLRREETLLERLNTFNSLPFDEQMENLQHHCIEFALYTSDLEPPSWRPF